MANTNAQIQTLIADATTVEQLNQIATDNNLTAPTSTELDAARLELQNIVNSHPDVENEVLYTEITPELAKQFNAAKPSSSTSTYFNKEKFGGKTLTGRIPVRNNGQPLMYVRSSDGETSASNYAIFVEHEGRTLVTFITPDDFNLIRTSAKPVDRVDLKNFDLYDDSTVIGAFSYRMPLTQSGQVKSV